LAARADLLTPIGPPPGQREEREKIAGYEPRQRALARRDAPLRYFPYLPISPRSPISPPSQTGVRTRRSRRFYEAIGTPTPSARLMHRRVQHTIAFSTFERTLERTFEPIDDAVCGVPFSVSLFFSFFLFFLQATDRPGADQLLMSNATRTAKRLFRVHQLSTPVTKRRRRSRLSAASDKALRFASERSRRRPSIPYCVGFLARYVAVRRSVAARNRRCAHRSPS